MFSVTFQPQNTSVSVPRGTSVLRAAKRAGLRIETPCGGHGTCRKCRLLTAGGAEILACLEPVLADVELRAAAANAKGEMKILIEGTAADVELEPYVKKISTPKEVIISGADGRLFRAAPPPSAAVRALGAVVDIGTTTLAAALVDLETGAELASASALNPQALRAQDVLSRIKIGSADDGLKLLHGEIAAATNQLLEQITRRAKVSASDIYEVVLSGNTTMLYLAVNEPPATLGKFPYALTLAGGVHRPAADVHLDIAPRGVVWLPPVVSAYVGADIVSGFLATGLERRAGVTLFIDIGTNGEMALAVNGSLSATSTAAGPAFEGMNIACGMRAAPGAVEFVELDADGVQTKTIGGEPAAGLCGSGLIDAVGELAAHGVIDRNGRFASPGAVPPQWRGALAASGGKPAFTLSGGVYLSQRDVRHVQLAKAAVRAGVELMLQTRGLAPADVDRVLIAGSFGYHLRPKSLLNLGLLPREFFGKIEFVGNTSKTGGAAFLLNGPAREQMRALALTVSVVELSNHADFEKVFVRQMAFPAPADAHAPTLGN